jgi:hypothetical protein
VSEPRCVRNRAVGRHRLQSRSAGAQPPSRRSLTDPRNFLKDSARPGSRARLSASWSAGILVASGRRPGTLVGQIHRREQPRKSARRGRQSDRRQRSRLTFFRLTQAISGAGPRRSLRVWSAAPGAPRQALGVLSGEKVPDTFSPPGSACPDQWPSLPHPSLVASQRDHRA